MPLVSPCYSKYSAPPYDILFYPISSCVLRCSTSGNIVITSLLPLQPPRPKGKPRQMGFVFIIHCSSFMEPGSLQKPSEDRTDILSLTKEPCTWYSNQGQCLHANNPQKSSSSVFAVGFLPFSRFIKMSLFLQISAFFCQTLCFLRFFNGFVLQWFFLSVTVFIHHLHCNTLKFKNRYPFQIPFYIKKYEYEFLMECHVNLM